MPGHDHAGGRRLRFSLAGTADWLMHGIRPAPASADGEPYEPGRWLTETDSPYGRLRHALPPVACPGSPGTWPVGPGRWGTNRPAGNRS
ncbi:hypothetical protein [Streptomyces sannanensis]|uniref:hypothetical protein n=1 Tax=Streptomyces sannanensis TaxID=285536 RepID=UPI0031ED8CFC